MRDEIFKLETNLDDCTGETLAYCMEKLFEAGAKDVWYTPIFMKKGRPAYALSVMCKEDVKDACIKVIFRETSAIGIEATPFLNCLATGESEMTAKDITLLLKQVEQACGDKPVLRSGNIIMMDIDLLLLGKKRYHTNDWNRDYIVELMALEPEIANYISLNIK